ncbi:serine acetyltransferase [Alkalimonas collagenimarina]|uniref:Serine acetyltransferase n=1 Tax=Alkalimonas collagenimarina TaxID=400390 RepID=A0ABT9GZB2_9GAMM|nr:serine acetyltransferase [Alkalimonas collagenimarina]MDP4536381.1 serine acetyltransferase [Alkalimonas collagenimarina]
MIKIFWQDIKQKQQFMLEQGYQVSTLRALLSDGSSANFLYRLTSSLVRYRLSPLAFITLWLNKVLNGCVLGAGCQFGPGLILMHPNGVVINSKVRGGMNVVIESGVVIGDEKGKAPVLGHGVFIGAGAKIIGGVSVGDHVKIGANAVVVKDLPDHVTAVGIPAKIIKTGVDV